MIIFWCTAKNRLISGVIKRWNEPQIQKCQWERGKKVQREKKMPINKRKMPMSTWTKYPLERGNSSFFTK